MTHRAYRAAAQVSGAGEAVGAWEFGAGRLLRVSWCESRRGVAAGVRRPQPSLFSFDPRRQKSERRRRQAGRRLGREAGGGAAGRQAAAGRALGGGQSGPAGAGGGGGCRAQLRRLRRLAGGRQKGAGQARQAGGLCGGARRGRGPAGRRPVCQLEEEGPGRGGGGEGQACSGCLLAGGAARRGRQRVERRGRAQ